MKRIDPSVLALLVLFSGCSAEIENPDPVPGGTHTVSFISSATETRTYVSEGEEAATYLWNSDDADYLHIYENDVKATSVLLELEQEGKVARIIATFPDSDASSFIYKGYYYKEISNAGNLKVLAEQSPRESSYDPQADLLVSKETAPMPAFPEEDLKLTFGRVAVISKVILRGMVTGETVSKVTITGSSALTGTFSPREDKWNPLGKVLQFENFEKKEVDDNGQFTFYFVSAPFCGTISISVTTDLNQYDKSMDRELTFEVGKMARLGINLENCGEPISNPGTTYSLVSSADFMVNGADYLIVGAVDQKYYAMGAQTRNNRSAVEIGEQPSGEEGNAETPPALFEITNAIKACPVRIEAATVGTETRGYFLIDNDPKSDTFGHYLYNDSSGSDNYLRSTEYPSFNCLWSIVIQDGVASIENFGNPACKALYFNSGDKLFNDYASLGSNKPLALYVNHESVISFNALCNPALVFRDAANAYSWDRTDDETSVFGFLGVEDTEPDVSYYSLDERIAVVRPEQQKVIFLRNGSTIISAFTKSDDEYKTGYAEYNVSFTGLPGGSVEDAFTVSDAFTFIDHIKEYTWFPSANEYYIKGKVSRIDGPFGSQFGTATFYISQDGSEESPQFEAYRVRYLDNAVWTEGDKQIDVGDEVVIRCKFDIFYDQYESYKKDGYLVSLEKHSPYFTAKLSAREITYEGGAVTLTLSANVDWTAWIDGGGLLKIGNEEPSSSVSGSTDTEVTVMIPENEDGCEYRVSFSSENPDVVPPEDLIITQYGKYIVIWNDDFSGIVSTDTHVLTELFGSKEGYGDAYTALDKVYPITGKLKVGGASAAGSLTTPALTRIQGEDVRLTITLTAAGWNGKKAKLTLSASSGEVSPSDPVSIASESTMSGNDPTMTGKTYTWTVTGADCSTVITISSNLAVGIDDLLIVQTN